MSGERLVALPRTATALEDLDANALGLAGSHPSGIVKPSNRGTILWEEAYDPKLHGRVLPNPLSITEELMEDDEYVTIREQEHPLEFEIVWYANPQAQRGEPFMVESKADMQKRLAFALGNTCGGYADRVLFHSIGDTERIDRGWLKDSETVTGTDDPEQAAKVAAKISNNGLTFVLADTSNFPLIQQLKRHNKALVISIKHLFEVERQPDTGSYYEQKAVGRRLYTDDERKVQRWNEQSAALNQAWLEQVGNRAMAAAQVVYEGPNRQPQYGFDRQSVDNAMASAVRKVKL